eukprot:Nk52_evm122s226 gene=Nk52_evmTU122s226
MCKKYVLIKELKEHERSHEKNVAEEHVEKEAEKGTQNVGNGENRDAKACTLSKDSLERFKTPLQKKERVLNWRNTWYLGAVDEQGKGVVEDSEGTMAGKGRGLTKGQAGVIEETINSSERGQQFKGELNDELGRNHTRTVQKVPVKSSVVCEECHEAVPFNVSMQEHLMSQCPKRPVALKDPSYESILTKTESCEIFMQTDINNEAFAEFTLKCEGCGGNFSSLALMSHQLHCAFQARKATTKITNAKKSKKNEKEKKRQPILPKIATSEQNKQEQNYCKEEMIVERKSENRVPLLFDRDREPSELEQKINFRLSNIAKNYSHKSRTAANQFNLNKNVKIPDYHSKWVGPLKPSIPSKLPMMTPWKDRRMQASLFSKTLANKKGVVQNPSKIGGRNIALLPSSLKETVSSSTFGSTNGPVILGRGTSVAQVSYGKESLVSRQSVRKRV